LVARHGRHSELRLKEQDTIKLKGAFAMEQHMFPDVSKDLAQKRRVLAPEIYGAFREFGQRVFADGALPSKTKQLIAVAVAHTTQCPYCIRGHTELALKKGATEQEIMEAIWVAAEMRAGAAYAHSVLAIDAMNQAEAKPAA
jgi:AhpD family alkylhydroperoxidase